MTSSFQPDASTLALQMLPAAATAPALRWVATDFVTGRVLDDVPSLLPQYPLKRTIGQYETVTAQLVLEGAHPNWERIVEPLASVLHCYDDTDPAKTPLWSGIVVQTTRTAGAGAVQLSLSSGEYYLDRRICGNYTVTSRGQNLIVEDLIAAFADDIGITVEYSGNGTARDRAWYWSDWASVYARLQDLSGVDGGPEWTMEWRWNDAGDAIRPYLLVADRLGSSPSSGLTPSAGFSMPGNLQAAEMVLDYSDGKGANNVLAYSSGEGDAVPISSWHAATGQDRPTVDYWFSPSTSITTISVLDAHAKAELADVKDGSLALTLTAALGAVGTPKLGADWRLGDDVYYRLDTPEFPGGIYGTARAIAVEVSDSTIAPIVVLSDAPKRIRPPVSGGLIVDGNFGGTVITGPGRVIVAGGS